MVLQTVPISAAGTYSVSVSDLVGVSGSYTLQLIVNAAGELESHGGSANDSLATAQNIDSSFISLGGISSRGAVLARADSTTGDFYTFTLAAGDTATIAAALTFGTLTLTLYDSAGAMISIPVAGLFRDIVIPSAGLYSVRISGSAANIDYSLVITRNAELDVESNDQISGAQPVSSRMNAGQQRILGTFSGNTSTSNLTSLDVGSWDSSGAHTSTNKSYVVGVNGTQTSQDYFVFNLASVKSTITSASLKIVNPSTGFNSADGLETLSLYDVSTSIANLEASGTGQTSIYDDLGSGILFGQSATSPAPDNGRTITIPLNAAAVEYLTNLQVRHANRHWRRDHQPVWHGRARHFRLQQWNRKCQFATSGGAHSRTFTKSRPRLARLCNSPPALPATVRANPSISSTRGSACLMHPACAACRRR